MTHKCLLLCCKHPNETYSCRSLPANRHEYPQTQLQGTWKPCNWVWCQWCHSPLEESLEGQNQHGQPIKESRHTVTYDIPIQHFYCMSIYLYSYLCVHPVQNSMYQYYIIYTVYIYIYCIFMYIYIYCIYVNIYILYLYIYILKLYCINKYILYILYKYIQYILYIALQLLLGLGPVHSTGVSIALGGPAAAGSTVTGHATAREGLFAPIVHPGHIRTCKSHGARK